MDSGVKVYSEEMEHVDVVEEGEEVVEEEIPEGYYITSDNVRFLMHGEKVLLEDPLLNYVGYGPGEIREDDWYFIRVFTQYELDGNVYVYLVVGRECGGCTWLDDDYLVINRNDDSINFDKLDLEHLDFIEKNGDIYQTVIHPDGKKFAYVSSSRSEEGWYELDGQVVWIFDLVREEWEKVYEVPDGMTVLGSGHGYYILDETLYWGENGELMMEPILIEDMENY